MGCERFAAFDFGRPKKHVSFPARSGLNGLRSIITPVSVIVYRNVHSLFSNSLFYAQTDAHK